MLSVIQDGYKKAMLYNSCNGSLASDADTTVQTGLLGIDLAAGVGGISKGQLIEVFGESDAGKSALALHLSAAFQKQGREVAYFDIEGKIHHEFAADIGVVVDDLLVGEASCAEDVFDTAELLALGGAVGLIIIDSVTALLPKEELSVTEFSVDGCSKCQLDVIRSGMRRLEIVAHRTGCCFVLVNQLRGDFNSATVNELKSAGGEAVMLRADMRIQLYKNTGVKHNGICIGQNIRARIIKNNITIKNLYCWLVLYYATGFSVIEGLILDAVDLGVLTKIDYEIYYKGESLGSNREEVSKNLEDSRNLYGKIVEEVKQKYS